MTTSSLPLIIPAAGRGSRLFPASWAIPKELFPLGNKPALHYLLEEARCASIRDIVCIASPRKEALSTYLQYEQSHADLHELLPTEAQRLTILDELNKSFSYSFAVQEHAKGVGDGMLLAKNMIKSPFFCMAYPDDILENFHEGLKKMIAAHIKYDCSIIAVEKVPLERLNAYGVISCGKYVDENLIEVKSIVEKPSTGSAPSEYGIVGRYLLTKDIFELLEEQKSNSPCFITALNELMHQGKKVMALVLQTTRYDIGTVPGWINAVCALNEELLIKSPHTLIQSTSQQLTI